MKSVIVIAADLLRALLEGPLALAAAAMAGMAALVLIGWWLWGHWRRRA